VIEGSLKNKLAISGIAAPEMCKLLWFENEWFPRMSASKYRETLSIA